MFVSRESTSREPVSRVIVVTENSEAIAHPRPPLEPIQGGPFEENTPLAADVRRLLRPLADLPAPALERDQYPIVQDNGLIRRYAPGRVLVKMKNEPCAAGLVVPEGSEVRTRDSLAQRNDIEFAELDVLLSRQFVPSDRDFAQQWHHATIGSTNAWDYNRGRQGVRVAILDLPFQMDHADLAANTVAGWDMPSSSPITSSPGDIHSTMGAGLAAAVLDNTVGVAGIANCPVLPVNVGEFPLASELAEGIRWAADQGIRVVNASFDGVDRAVINDAGRYLRDQADGILVMAGVNTPAFLTFPNHPYVWAIAMTDSADRQRSSWGRHIDFAAPGWQIYSTSTNSSYQVDSGTSYSAPLVSGILAFLFSVNPQLAASEAEEILKTTARDLGTTGWDQFYGWGRIEFGLAARRAFETSPGSRIAPEARPLFGVRTVHVEGAAYNLLRSVKLTHGWTPIPEVVTHTNGAEITLRDPAPPSDHAFYRLQITLP